EFLKNFDNSQFANQTLLIKGARSFHLEEIVSVLEEKTHQTVLEINLNSITHNLNYFKSKLKSETKIMVMIKAFGYGSGSFEIAKLLEYHKVNYLGVAFVDEGIALRNAGITTPIIVMNPEPSGFSALVSNNLEPEIYSLKELQTFQKEVEKQNRKNYPIHLKIDSGMHRLGFVDKYIPALLEHLKSNSNLFEIKSIFSHFSASDNLEFQNFTQEQFAVFNKLSSAIKEQLNIQPICHISNTSAISNHPEFQKDMVRLGIVLYGISNIESEMTYLENCRTLKSVIIQIIDIQKGESVGYSRGFMAGKPIRTASIPVGYADGIAGAWGRGRGSVMINNKKA